MPNQEFKLQIDYILVPPTAFKRIMNWDTSSNFQFHSDHRPVFCKYKTAKSRYHRPPKQAPISKVCRTNSAIYQSQVNAKLDALLAGGEEPNWNPIQKILKAASDEVPPLPKETKYRKRASQKYSRTYCEERNA